jgi:hypothetical protein
MKRYAIAAAVVFAMGLSGVAVSQDTSSSGSQNSSSMSSSSSDQQPSSEKMGAQDPKMKKCMAAQKAKNNGLSDDQIKQKCMAHVMSHQDKNSQQSSPQ